MFEGAVLANISLITSIIEATSISTFIYQTVIIKRIPAITAALDVAENFNILLVLL
jgi:hypothetical protein